MDKISFYNIQESIDDNVLLYNTLSDSMVAFTQNEFGIVSSLFENLIEFSSQYPVLYEELKKAGFIISDSFDELEYIKFQNKRRIFANNDFHITINPTLDCNLQCWYCSTEYAKAKHNGCMTPELVDGVKNHIKHVIEEQRATSLVLDWFGGEPLMFFNEVIEPISSYTNDLAEKNSIRFSQHITTNATLLNSNRIQRMRDLRFTSFQIPIDGNEYRHNKIKFFDNKRGTYRSVINNINEIAESILNVRITMRINYDKQTLKHIQDIIQDISETAKQYIQVDFQKVWQIKANDRDVQLLKEIKDIFRLNGLNSDFWAYTPKVFHRCYSDKYHHYAINYNGKIFKCTAQDYGDDKVIGELLSNGEILWNDTLLSKLFSHSTFENERCLNCKRLPICMGPCIIRNFESRINNTPLPCIADYVQYSLSSYIIEEAKKREIIK